MEAFVQQIKAPRDALVEERISIYERHATNAFNELRFLNPEIGKHDYHLYLIPICDPSNKFYDQRECGEYVRDYFIDSGFFAKLKGDASLVFISWDAKLVERQKRSYIQRFIQDTKAATGTDAESAEGKESSEGTDPDPDPEGTKGTKETMETSETESSEKNTAS